MKKIFYWTEAFFTIVGAVVGLGIFSIPYASKNIGVLPGVILIICVTLIMMFLNILFAEIIIFDKKDDCIVGYSRKYLGGWAGKIEFFSILFGYGGSLVAYILATAVFTEGILSMDKAYFWPIVLIFTAVNSMVLLNGFRGFGKIELVFSVLMCGMFFLVSYESLPHWSSLNENWSGLLVPYGVVIFALTGQSSIPIAIKILGAEKKKIREVIVYAYIFIAIITILFFISAIKTSGLEVTPNPFISMSKKMGSGILYLGSLLGLITVITSHWAIAIYLKKILISDIKLKTILSWFLVVFAPLTLILAGVSNFVHIIGLVGVVAGTTDALIIVAVYRKIFHKKKSKPIVLPWKLPRYLTWTIFLLLVFAAISSILSSVKG